MGIYLAADPVLADRQMHPIRLDDAGRVMSGSSSPVSAATLLRVKIEAAGVGDNTIIAAPGVGMRLRLFHFNFLTRAAVNVRLLSGGNDISGLYNFLGNSGFAFDSAGGLYPTILGENEAFIINLSGAVGIDGYVLYTSAP